jgi:hypothetical protein
MGASSSQGPPQGQLPSIYHHMIDDGGDKNLDIVRPVLFRWFFPL